jgi:hypothetical protein
LQYACSGVRALKVRMRSAASSEGEFGRWRALNAPFVNSEINLPILSPRHNRPAKAASRDASLPPMLSAMALVAKYAGEGRTSAR